jgi:large subunit ribosomal protein L30
MTESNEPKKLKITLVKSGIGYSEKHKATLRALGLRKLNQSVVQEETSTLRGMLLKINHLVKVEDEE